MVKSYPRPYHWHKISDGRPSILGADILVCWKDGNTWQYRACEVWHGPSGLLTGHDTHVGDGAWWAYQVPPEGED